MSDQIDPREHGDGDRGRRAQSPTDIPAKGWKDVLTRTATEAKQDHAVLLAAGVAFFGLLALLPTMVAAVSLYGLVADPADVTRHVDDLLGAAPGAARDLILEQLRGVTSESSGSVGVGFAVGLAVALWAASSGVKHLMDALNAAYDEEEGRGFVKVRGLALLFTLGAIVFVVGAVLMLAVVPVAVEASGLGETAGLAINVVRWPLLAVGFAVALAVLYRYAPSRDDAEWRWVSPGAIVATALWLLASAAFSIYVSSFSSYNETYGSLAGVVIAMLWLFLTALSVVLGAELDSEMERQTTTDTTRGRTEPMGARDAYAADTVGRTAEQVKVERQRAKVHANP